MSIIEWNRPCFTIFTTRFNLSHSFLYFCHFFWTQKTKFFTNLGSVSSVSTVATIFASDAWWTLNALDALRTLDTSVKKEEKIFFCESLVFDKIFLGQGLSPRKLIIVFVAFE